jgi:spermidine/putrescine transport system permease protein
MSASPRVNPASPNPSPSSSNADRHRDWNRVLGGWGLLGPAGLWLFLLLILPTLIILELSFAPGFQPENTLDAYDWTNYFQAFEPLYLQVIGRSIFLAIGTTLLCLAMGFPVAYWIAILSPVRWRNLLLLGFIMPLWTSSLLRSYAWITILRPTGVLNTILTTIGLPALDIFNRPPAVLIGMSYSYLPYMVLVLYSSLERLDRRLLEASADLGASPPKTFWKITVPQTAPGIWAGGLLVFISSLGDFVDPELLGGASSMTITRLIYNQFLGAARNWGFGSALSMLLMLFVSLAMVLLIKYGDSNARGK